MTTTEQRARKAAQNRTYRERLTPEQKQALTARERENRHIREAKRTPEQRETVAQQEQILVARREKRHAREAAMTPEQRAEARAKQQVRTERYRAAHTERVRKPRQAPVISPFQQARMDATQANQLEFERAIRRIVAAAAKAGTLDRSSDWFGLSSAEILAAPLVPMRDARYSPAKA